MTKSPPPASKGLDPSTFTTTMTRISSWASDYLESLETRPVHTNTTPGDTLNKLPAAPPANGIDANQWDALLASIDSAIVPNLVHWQSPNFFAYFPCSASMPAIAGEFISAVLNVNGMLWSTSPAATELEMRMLDWCADMFNLPATFRFDAPNSKGGGCIQSTASEGVLSSLLSARRSQTKQGIDRSKVTLYTSTQAHSSVVKSAMVAGLADTPEDYSRIRLIETDDELRMDVGLLRSAIQADLENGLAPALVVATVGTTSTGAIDPIDDIGNMLNEFGDARPFFHVDAAWAGAACVCPEHQHILQGIHHADALCINPHKWLLTNFDCDLYWVRDREALVDSMSITPEYLRNKATDSGAVIDYRDWHVPLGRRMRALKLWLVIQHFGVNGLQAHIRHHVALAEQFERWVHANPALESPTPRTLGLVCFRLKGENGLTQRLIDHINDSGTVLISHALVPIEGNMTLIARVAVGATSVNTQHIEELCSSVERAIAGVVQ
jgi:aromatic-L-amino-acid decarboxylase